MTTTLSAYAESSAGPGGALPSGGIGLPGGLSARFWAKVEKAPEPNGCWIWRGALHRDGYGAFGRNGRVEQAHRVAWDLSGGEGLAEGGWLRNACGDKRCVRPEHQRLRPPVGLLFVERGPVPPKASLTELVERVRDNDRQALAELYRRTRSLLSAWLKQRGYTPSQADDAIQNAFIQLPAAARHFDRRCLVLTWLGRETRRTACLLAQGTPHLEPEEAALNEPDPAATPEQRAAGTETLNRLGAALEHLPIPQREALLATVLEGATGPEIAERLGVSAWLANRHVRDAREALKETAEAA